MFSELLPNIISTVVAFFTLNIANKMPSESARSGAGFGRRTHHGAA